MSEHEIVSAAQATIQGLVEQLRLVTGERDEARRERDEARALLARSKTSLAEKFNDPMEGAEHA